MLSATLLACTPQNAQRAPASAAREGVVRDPFERSMSIEQYVLSNGLTVILNRDRRVPLVAVRVVYRVGAVDDPPALSGMAHLLEHLMFHGSRNVPDQKHHTLLHEAGAGDIGATTAPERTDYYEVVPSSELSLALWLESDRMASGLATLSDATLSRERLIVQHERAERVDTVAGGLIGLLVAEQLFLPGHPYATRRVIDENVEKISAHDVREFHRIYYVPNRALLVLSGDFDPAKAKSLIAKHFAPIPAGPVPPARPRSGPVLREARSVRFEAPIDRTLVILAWATPPAVASGDAELDIVARHLSAELLSDALVEKELASSVHAAQQSRELASVFQIIVEVRPNITAEQVTVAVDQVLDTLRVQGLTPHVIHQGAWAWAHQVYVAQDDVLQRSWWMSQEALLTGNPDFVKQAARRYRAATTASVADTIAKHLRPESRIVATVTPNPNAPLAGRIVSER